MEDSGSREKSDDVDGECSGVGGEGDDEWSGGGGEGDDDECSGGGGEGDDDECSGGGGEGDDDECSGGDGEGDDDECSGGGGESMEPMEDENQKALMMKNQQINEEYTTWKQQSAFLYDLVINHALEWPSLTVEWLPNRYEPPGKDYCVQNIILGTHTTNEEPNYLMRAQVQIPNEDAKNYVGERGGIGDKVHLVQQISVDGEVLRARYMPQNPIIIATKTINPEVFVFNYRKHPSKSPAGAASNPDLRLRGHSSYGYGLSWSPFKQGYLLSGSSDTQICMWDIQGTSENKALDALQIFKVHERDVQDVAWHLKHAYLFGSVGDDHRLVLCDLRLQSVKPIHSLLAHEGPVNSLSFNPFNEWILATGSSDKTVKVFDIRDLKSAVFTFNCHKAEVYKVGWNPNYETVLASSCHGRRLMVWDLSRFDVKQTPEEAVEGPPELLFIHGGHTDKITDFSWNPCQDWLVASVAKDNVLQIWEMADKIHIDDDSLSEDEQQR